MSLSPILTIGDRLNFEINIRILCFIITLLYHKAHVCYAVS